MPCLSSGGILQQIQGYSPAKDIHEFQKPEELRKITSVRKYPSVPAEYLYACQWDVTRQDRCLWLPLTGVGEVRSTTPGTLLLPLAAKYLLFSILEPNISAYAQ